MSYNDKSEEDVIKAVAGVILIASLIGVAAKNSSELDARFKALDNGATVAFNSSAACTAKGYAADSCAKAEAEANDIASSLGTKWSSYSSMEECKTAHSLCTEERGRRGRRSYYPVVIGWQALASDLSQAVPLYALPEQNVAIRGDKKQVSLTTAPQKMSAQW